MQANLPVETGTIKASAWTSANGDARIPRSPAIVGWRDLLLETPPARYNLVWVARSNSRRVSVLVVRSGAP
eukprot:3050023-Pyramimonas_sp.AAC.1